MLIKELLQLNEEDMTVKLSKDGKNWVVTSVKNKKLANTEDGGFEPGDSIVKNQLKVTNGKSKYNGYIVRVLSGNLKEEYEINWDGSEDDGGQTEGDAALEDKNNRYNQARTKTLKIILDAANKKHSVDDLNKQQLIVLMQYAYDEGNKFK